MRSLLKLAVCAATFFFMAGCKRVPPPKPLSELTQPEAHGHAVFQAHCAQCHNDRSDAALHGPPLLGITKKPYLPSGAPSNDERITATILHGRNLMPAQPNLDQLEIQDLLAYLHTL